MLDTPTCTTRDTSAQSYNSITQTARKGFSDEILAIVVAAQRAGAADMSGQEIRKVLEEQRSQAFGRAVRVDTCQITSPIDRLITAKRLVRMPYTRPCSITGMNIHPVQAVAVQGRLAA